MLINRKLPITVTMVIYSLNKLSSDFLQGFPQDSSWSILNSHTQNKNEAVTDVGVGDQNLT